MAARAVLMAAAQHGVSAIDLCRQIGLAPQVVEDVDGRVDVSVMLRLWDAVAPLDADFGLHLAEMSGASHLAQPALPWHLLRASATLMEGIARLVAAWRVFNDIHPPELEMPSERAPFGALRMRTKDTPYPVPRHAAEYTFAWFVVAARQATGTDIAPLKVAFEHPAPASATEHARIFRCPVEFAQPATMIAFSLDQLLQPTLSGGDHELVRLLERHTDTLIATLPSTRGFAAEVRAAMTPLLASGDVSVERVASALSTSARSIQRRLREEATTFQRELDELRRELATQYLRDGEIAIAEIAFLLGFSDQSAFHRAFVRWTGKTPGDFRRGSRRC